jgi:hypothetical protein
MLNPTTTAQSLEQKDMQIVFHIGRDPEFLQGIQDGRTLLPPPEWDLAGTQGWWNVEDLLQFVQTELSLESQTKENALRACAGAAPHTPIYNLGLVAGLLATLANVATDTNASAQRRESHA